MGVNGLRVALCLLVAWTGWCVEMNQSQCQLRLELRVMSPRGEPVAGAEVRITGPGNERKGKTDAVGQLTIENLCAGSYLLEVTHGATLQARSNVELRSEQPAVKLEITLQELIHHEQVEVKAEEEAGAGAGLKGEISTSELPLLPQDPGSVRDALPMLPGVTRTPEGKLRISDRPEHQSAFLVNGLDVTDPATAEFGQTVPVDAVASLEVYRSPFLAEFGRFTAGVVAVETKMGRDQWHWELQDPTPELRIRSRRLRGIRGLSPRLIVTGPLKQGRLYYLQAVEYRLKKTPVFSLGFPENEDRQESINGLVQLDAHWSDRQWLRFSLHGVPYKHAFAGLNFHEPRPTTPTLAGHEYRASLVHRVNSAFGLMETTAGAQQVAGKTWPQGDEAHVFRPVQNAGNYFMTLRRWSERYQVAWSLGWPTIQPDAGRRTKIGLALSYLRSRGWYRARRVLVENSNGSLIQEVLFRNRPGYQQSEWEQAFFIQQDWKPMERLQVSYGLRIENQSEAGTWRLGPRAGLAWWPMGGEDLVLRAGVGWFYDRVPMAAYSFSYYPDRTITFYQNSEPMEIRYRNVLAGGLAARALLVFGEQRPGSFAPRSLNWMVQFERGLSWLDSRLRLSYLESRNTGLLIIDKIPGHFGTGQLLLKDGGQARNQQLELLWKFQLGEEGELVAAYVNNRTRGNVNDFLEFLGRRPVALVRPDNEAPLKDTIPHRFLLWGVLPVREDIRVAPVVEYRSGFPFSVFDAAQEYVEPPYSRRFPNFFSLDLRISKDMQWREYRYRLSFSVFNLTNHFNPDTVRNNIADSLFGEFLGNHDRRFRVDFDILF